MAKLSIVIDLDLCIGCNACTVACKAEHGTQRGVFWGKVLEHEVGRTPAVRRLFLPVLCNHCESPPCREVCPTRATYVDKDGVVLIDYDKCIGCRYCEVACPYNARAFNWDAFNEDNPAVPQWGQPEVDRRPRGVVEKCSFCYQRIDRGLMYGLTPGVDEEATPACAVACPVGARHFGDLNDPESNVSRLLRAVPSFRLREDLGTAPHVYYLAAREEG